jgi:hypothetical protein
MKHKIKRIIQKIGIFLVKKFHHSGREKLTKTEIEASIVFTKLLLDPKTDLLISPLSSKYYLKNDDRKLLVVLSNMNISIINHIFGYDVSIPVHMHERLRSTFNDEVENRRQKMEDEYRNNVIHNLQKVIKSLKNEEK